MGTTIKVVLKPISLIVLIFFLFVSIGTISDARAYKEESKQLKKTVISLKADSIKLESQLEEKSIYMKGFENEFVAVKPLKGEIVITSHYKTKTRPDHDGIDIVSYTNDTVFAIRAGYAERKYQTDTLGNLTGYGRYIKITDNIYSVEYGHLKRFLLQKNKNVEAGEAIAIMGTSGTSTGTHLHLTIIKKTVNPNKMIWKK